MPATLLISPQSQVIFCFSQEGKTFNCLFFNSQTNPYLSCYRHLCCIQNEAPSQSAGMAQNKDFTINFNKFRNLGMILLFMILFSSSLRIHRSCCSPACVPPFPQQRGSHHCAVHLKLSTAAVWSGLKAVVSPMGGTANWGQGGRMLLEMFWWALEWILALKC